MLTKGQRHTFWRTMSVMSCFNCSGMQNFGLCYALEPGLREIFPDPERLQQALVCETDVFNTHPYFSALTAGMILHEERKAAEEGRTADIARIREGLMGPLAAIGDNFFWNGLKPAVAIFAVLAVLAGHWYLAALILAVAYNAAHLFIRYRLFVLGLSQGQKALSQIATWNLPRNAERLRLFALGSLGACAVFYIKGTAVAVGAITINPIAGIAAGALALWMTKAPGNRGWQLLYLTAAACVAVAILAGGS